MTLHRCQEELGGWVSPETMEDLAAYFEMEPVEVYGVASFYPMFRMSPPGKHVVSVCHNIACELRGAPDILKKVPQSMKERIKPEFIQSMVEINTDICSSVAEVEKDLKGTYSKLNDIAEGSGAALFLSSIHPFSKREPT